MDLGNISVNTQSSIRISGSKVLYFDAFKIADKVQDADIIFITHDHPDHFDADSVKNIINENSIIIAPDSMKERVTGGIDADKSRFVFMVPGTETVAVGIKVKAVPAYNDTKPFHTRDKKWLGYVVQMDGVTYFVAGDTDPVKENESISCDVALLPVGGGFTMDAEQAAEYAAKIGPKAAIPTHYGDMVGHPEDGKKFMQYAGSINKNIQVELKLSF